MLAPTGADAKVGARVLEDAAMFFLRGTTVGGRASLEPIDEALVEVAYDELGHCYQC